MRMNAKKRFLSLLLCGAMLFSLCPQAAFAEGAAAGGLCEHHPQHTAECGYAEDGEGAPCTYVCEICNPQDSGEAEDTGPEAACTCTGLCTEETVNADCPVCGAEGADLTACEGMEAEMATLSTALAVEARAAAGAFEVTGGTSGTDYSYSDGVLTVNDGANITISMANGATTPTSDRIVVAANATATITLNGVSITGPGPDISSGAPAQSAIDVGENAHLILNLSDNTTNALTGGSGGIDLGAPGIHVPSSASLVIQGSGELSVTGGNSTNTYGGSGIGGKPSSGQAGEACGTVIILATGTVTVTGGTGQTSSSGGADIGGGLGTTDGDNGQGIRLVSGQENTYTVWGDLTLPDGITIPGGVTVVVPDGTSLTVPEGTRSAMARVSPGGALAVDDTRWAVAQSRRQYTALLVTEGNVFLEEALRLRPELNLVLARPQDVQAATGCDLYIYDGVEEPGAGQSACPAGFGEVRGDGTGDMVADGFGRGLDAAGRLGPQCREVP